MNNSEILKKAWVEDVRGLAGRGINKLLSDIVHCKNCRHWNAVDSNGMTCMEHCWYVQDAEYFCAQGEKKEMDEEMAK